MKTIPCSCGRNILVDDEDYTNLVKLQWRCTKDVVLLRNCKLAVPIAGNILIVPKGFIVDHIDRDGHNNQQYNLRKATNAQNSQNQTVDKSNTSGYKGVSWRTWSNKWLASIYLNSKKIYIGMYENKIDAAKAYDVAAKQYHGEFAVLNFPDSCQPNTPSATATQPMNSTSTAEFV